MTEKLKLAIIGCGAIAKAMHLPVAALSDQVQVTILVDKALPRAREISSRSYRKMRQNVALAFLFNGIGIPLAATGLVYPVWAMAAMAASVTTIFFNSLWGRPGLFFQAILSVGRPIEAAPQGA